MPDHDRVYEVDLLRFVAAAAVVVFHYAFRGAAADGLSPLSYPPLMPAAQYGYLGVELFFMISGFVILMSAADGSLRRFFVSRVVRLYPAFWACCTLTALALWIGGHPALHVGWRQYLLNLTMLGDFIGTPRVDGVYWSLFVEIRFYLWVALILALGWLPRLGLLLWVWLGVTTLQRFVHTGPLWTWLIAEYAPFFIGGAACYLMRRDGPRPSTLALFALSLPLALVQSLQQLKLNSAHYPGGSFSAVWVVGGVLLIYLLMLGVAFRRLGWLASPRFVALGALTYPLYLLHQNIGYVLFRDTQGWASPHLLFWGIFALMVGASWAVHRGVERPLAPRIKAALNRLLDRLVSAGARRRRLT
jgi:peptidoglycan/LPS O-acetylase OafA/YrhL